MTTLKALLRQSGAALRVLIVLTVLTGLAYPLMVWSVAHLPGLASKAEGSVVTVDGQRVGSSLIGVDLTPTDPASDPYFHTRPSASASDPLGPGDPSTSRGSNKALDNPDLVKLIDERRTQIAAREGVAADAVPPDAVTASASGVDPDISLDYAKLQAPRVSKVTGLRAAGARPRHGEHRRPGTRVSR